MPSDTMPTEAEPAPDADANAAEIRGRLPVLATLVVAYRFIGERFIAFAGIATVVGVGNYLLYSQSPLSPGAAVFSLREVALHWIILLASLGFASIVYAVAGVRWCRVILLGERPPRYVALPGSREVRFALGIALLAVVLALPGLMHLLLATRVPFAVTDWVEQRLFLSPDILGIGIILALQIAAMALLCLALPAIAMDGSRPLEHGVRMGVRDFRPLFAVYLVGLIPWSLLKTLGFTVLAFRIDIERLAVAGSILDAWMMVCTIALAAASFRSLADHHAQLRIAGVFE
jgi:hypothetical protein